MRKLLAVYLLLAVVAAMIIARLPGWAVTGIAIGGGALFAWFVLYINRHSE